MLHLKIHAYRSGRPGAPFWHGLRIIGTVLFALVVAPDVLPPLHARHHVLHVDRSGPHHEVRGRRLRQRERGHDGHDVRFLRVDSLPPRRARPARCRQARRGIRLPAANEERRGVRSPHRPRLLLHGRKVGVFRVCAFVPRRVVNRFAPPARAY